MQASTLCRPVLATAFVALAGAACTVEVVDRTVSPFTYDPPINTQTFRVDVLSTGDVAEVELESPGAGVAPMVQVSDERWETSLPVPACVGAVEFSVDVRYQAGFGYSTETFPEAGAFTHQVTGLPEDCEDFADNFAQTFVVDETSDFPDLHPGDGECSGIFSGLGIGCSLRAAVMEANAKPGNDLIRVPSGRYVLTRFAPEDATGINHSVRDLDITESVTIEGMSGANTHLDAILQRTNDPQTDLTDDGNQFGFVRIDGNGEHRIFHVTAPDVVLRLRRVAILHGDEAGAGGGVLNDGTLTLERVAFAENSAESVTGGAFGGGAVQNNGILIGEDVAFVQNDVQGQNPSGGGLHNTGEATIRRLLVAYNDARFGAAIRNVGGTLTLGNATVYNNFWVSPTSTPPVSVLSTTSGGETRLSFVTLAAHSLGDRDLVSNSGSTVHVKNGLWVDNSADLCAGSILSDGGNVVEGECGFSVASAPLAPDHEDVGLVAGPGQLEDRGGFLPVVEIDPPFAGSSAFDARDLGHAPPFPFTDQRGQGFGRRIDGNGDGMVRSDPGAYEYAP